MVTEGCVSRESSILAPVIEFYGIADRGDDDDDGMSKIMLNHSGDTDSIEDRTSSPPQETGAM